jgi:hypothetical protein
LKLIGKIGEGEPRRRPSQMDGTKVGCRRRSGEERSTMEKILHIIFKYQ